jgi:hypothetical protein
MTAILILTVLLMLAVAGPLFGADTRSSGGWAPSDPNQPLWSDAGIRAAR